MSTQATERENRRTIYDLVLLTFDTICSF